MSRIYDIAWYNELDSTNSEAQRRIDTLGSLSVLAAEKQTAGRGQRGNVWQTAPSENLTFTIVLKPGREPLPELKARNQFAVSEAVTLALTDYLGAEGISPKIKWPNDIYVSDKKICGILIENSVRDNLLSSSIIGIGLNLNQTVFPSDIPNPVSMKLLTGRTYDTEKELREFLVAFDRRLDAVFSEQGRTASRTAYLDRLYRIGECHEFIRTADSLRFKGTIKGISADACLLVEDTDGNLNEFSFKEIQYVI